jgi:hypothetical protein
MFIHLKRNPYNPGKSTFSGSIREIVFWYSQTGIFYKRNHREHSKFVSGSLVILFENGDVALSLIWIHQVNSHFTDNVYLGFIISSANLKSFQNFVSPDI